MLEIQIQHSHGEPIAEPVAPLDEANAGSHEKSAMTPELFAAGLLEKGIPVDPHRATEVGKIILQEGGTPELLRKLVECFRFISKEEFDQDVIELGEQIKKVIGGREYNLMLYHRYQSTLFGNKNSGDWLFEMLTKKGVPPPTSNLDNLNVARWNTNYLYRPNIFIDDWAFSGQQVSSFVNNIIDKLQYRQKKEVHVFLLYCGSELVSTLQAAGATVHIISSKPIKRLATVLTATEQALLKQIGQGKNYSNVEQGSSLVFGWWKMPDNFYGMFVHPSPLALVRSIDFYPPYRQLPI